MMWRRVGQVTTRRAFHASRASPLAVHTVQVPSMGDSISEGTLVQIVKASGDAVHADEVVAVLETDKVSVDVMSPVAGTIVEHFAKLEENVLVGASLFSVDDSRAPEAGSAVAAPVTPAATPVAAPVAASGHRSPLIKFLGKRALLPSKPSPLSQPSGAAPRVSVAVQPSSADVLPFQHVKKLPISSAEVAAINSGLSFL
ncbi:hypothetical protein Poli38472_000407 [Pythium oligandrum]|uniref:Lipoyl-binding domain-containing protein n=1 Tax=Pythium oligandrum TaxID=41045 RepID=A0A8K1CCN0_PYTOL|nr:hypothetical protein Poli38472_000407 [Pythium oligandrum]|eukprot:TMW60365.1 hypothetical protein Poli38472_000407 [Pythium oligandrum]